MLITSIGMNAGLTNLPEFGNAPVIGFVYEKGNFGFMAEYIQKTKKESEGSVTLNHKLTCIVFSNYCAFALKNFVKIGLEFNLHLVSNLITAIYETDYLRITEWIPLSQNTIGFSIFLCEQKILRNLILGICLKYRYIFFENTSLNPFLCYGDVGAGAVVLQLKWGAR